MALMACMLPELIVLLEIFEVKRPGAAVVAVFCQELYVFPITDGGDLFPSFCVTILFSLALGFFFLKGRRPVPPGLLPWCLSSVRSLSMVGGLFWQKIFALKPDFG